jgi:hypothetical protein
VQHQETLHRRPAELGSVVRIDGNTLGLEQPPDDVAEHGVRLPPDLVQALIVIVDQVGADITSKWAGWSDPTRT